MGGCDLCFFLWRFFPITGFEICGRGGGDRRWLMLGAMASDGDSKRAAGWGKVFYKKCRKTLAPPSLLGGQNGRKAELSNCHFFFGFWWHFSEPGLCSTQADGGDMKCIVFTRRLDLFGSWAFNVCLRRALQPLVSSGFLVTCRKCRYDPSLTDLNESVQRPFIPFKKP